MLAALIQLVTIMDFMMVMPLGPYLVSALGIPASHTGYIAGSYTLTAALSGFIFARYMDRFDRKNVALLALAGLGIATFSASLAWDLPSLLAARMVAGLFGGPVAAITLSMVMDSVPNERRGRAMAIVMGSFSVAAIAGIPLGLTLADYAGWQAPFYALAGIAAMIWLGIAFLLPAMTSHLKQARQETASMLSLFARRDVRQSYLMMGAGTYAGFLLVPNLATFFSLNLGFPEGDLGKLYLIGGIVSLFAMQAAGYVSDKLGPIIVTAGATLLMIVTIYSNFVITPVLPVLWCFVFLMSTNTMLRVTGTTVSSYIPEPHERAGFMSLQTAIQQLCCGLAAFTSSMILGSDDGALTHMPELAALAILVALIQPVVLASLYNRRRQSHSAGTQAAAATNTSI